MPISIRQAQSSDAAPLMRFARRCYAAAFGDSFAAADLAAHLDRTLNLEEVERSIESDVVLLATSTERLIGYAQFGPAHPAADLEPVGAQELRRLYVDAVFQNRGVGSALMQAALTREEMARAERIYLEVWSQNHAAQRFYRRHGFEIVGERPFAVASGARTTPELLMVRRTAHLP